MGVNGQGRFGRTNISLAWDRIAYILVESNPELPCHFEDYGSLENIFRKQVLAAKRDL